MLSKRYILVQKQRLFIEVSEVNLLIVIVLIEFIIQIYDIKCQGWGVVEFFQNLNILHTHTHKTTSNEIQFVASLIRLCNQIN